ncbi:MAG TPA: EamA family transporter [Longimicrobiales bacterium]
MKSPYRAHAALFGMVIIWGVNFSVSKIALSSVSPLAFNALRFPLASLLLLGVLAAQRRIDLPARPEIPRVLAVGLLGNVVYQLCFIFGLNATSAGNASLLLASTPILTALLSAALGHERVHARTWLGVSCTFAGIVLIVLGGVREANARGSIIGDVLMLSASVMWAFYTVGSRPLVDRHGAIMVTAWTLWVGTVGIVMIGIPELLRLDWSALRPATWGAIAYAGLLSIGLSYIFWYYGVGVLGNTRTSSYSNVTPVVALIAAWLWLAEVPRLLQIVGAAIIIGGVTVAQSGVAARSAAVSPEV